MSSSQYPDGTSAGRSRNMAAIRRRDTRPERAIRSALHKRGWRYRVDLRIDLAQRTARPDLVFTARKVAVFVDGCFWHGCPEHGSRPRLNTGYWNEKLEKNAERDKLTTTALEEAGWRVIRVWEHEETAQAVSTIESVLDER